VTNARLPTHHNRIYNNPSDQQHFLVALLPVELSHSSQLVLVLSIAKKRLHSQDRKAVDEAVDEAGRAPESWARVRRTSRIVSKSSENVRNGWYGYSLSEDAPTKRIVRILAMLRMSVGSSESVRHLHTVGCLGFFLLSRCMRRNRIAPMGWSMLCDK
jgi:hypothetical protein